jgi:hypothetical protein
MPQSFRANLIIEGSIRKIGTELEVRARIVNVALGHSERLANFKVAAASVPEIVREISSSIVLEARKMLQLVSEPPAIGATVPLCLASPL